MLPNRFQTSKNRGRLNSLFQPVRELRACALTAAMMAVPDAPSPASSVRRLTGQDASGTTDAPVVLVHGYGGAKTQWLFVERALVAAGYHDITTMEYDACRTDIPGLARQLCRLVQRVAAERGARRVHLVGHSLGGVIIRYAVTVLGLDELVGAAVTIASPHGGSPVAHMATSVSGAQLRPGSALLRQLESAARPGQTRWTAFGGGCDVVVPPSRARLRPTALAATNVTVPGEGHLSILLSNRVARAVADAVHAVDDEPQVADRYLAAA
jgi:triacylglycerol esterase/lipase EstA (alpha/beta hydrolase family)